MTTGHAPEVFISYARSDGESFAERLFESLRERGIDAFFDRRTLDPYQDFTAMIEKALKRSTHVAVCVTADTKRGNSFVRREVQYAVNLPKPIVPLRFAPILPPISIATLSYIDFLGDWNGPFDALVMRLRRPVAESDFAEPPRDPFREHLKRLSRFVVDELDRTVLDPDDILELRTSGGGRRGQRSLPVAYRSRRPSWAVPTERADQPFASFAEAFEHHDRTVVLLGDPGGGKTTTLLVAVREAVNLRLDDPTAPVPVYAPIRTWDGQREVVPWLADATGTDRAALAEVVRSRNAVLFLDGLDELRQVLRAGEDRRLALLRLIAGLDPGGSVITCRSAEYEELASRAGSEPDVGGVVRLMPLSDDQIAQYLDDDPELLAAVRSDRELREMADNPLVLTLLALAYRDEGEQALELRDLKGSPTEMRSRIFSRYVARRYDFEAARLDEGARLRFAQRELYELLGAIALHLLDGFQRVELVFRPDGYTVTRYESGPVGFVEFGVREARQRLGPTALPVLALARRLQLVVPAEPRLMRFVHVLIRDHFAFGYCIERLRGDDPDERRAAAGALGLIGDARAVSSLVDALGDASESVRLLACWSLGELGDPAAVEPLLGALRQLPPDATIPLMVDLVFEALGKLGPAALGPLTEVARGNAEPVVGLKAARDAGHQLVEHAVGALGRIGPAAVPALIEVLEGGEYGAESAAIEALGRIGDPRAVPPLARLVRRGHLISAAGAAQALGNIGDEQALPALIEAGRDSEVEAAWQAVAAIGGPRALAALAAAVRDDDPATRRRAAAALGRLRDAEPTPTLEPALGDPDFRVRAAAVEALEERGIDAAVLDAARPSTRELLSALGDPDTGVAAEAARMLRDRREPGVTDALLSLSGSAPEWVRLEALSALAAHGDCRAIEPLCERMFVFDEFDFGRTDDAVISALGTIPDADAARCLLAALDDRDEWVRDGVVSALATIGAAAVEPLVDALPGADPNLRWLIGSALARVGQPAVDGLVGLLDSDAADTAAEALGAIGAAAVPALVRTLRHPSPDVRVLSAWALGNAGDGDAVGALLAAMQDLEDDVRAYTGSALTEIGEPAVEQLVALLRTADVAHRTAVVEVLGAIGDARAVEALSAALGDPAPPVRRGTVAALAAIAGADVELELTAQLDDPDPLVRSAAVDALVGNGADEDGLANRRPSVDELLDMLRSADPGGRAIAAYLLAAAVRRHPSASSRVADGLGSALADPDAVVRLEAARTLAHVGRVRTLVDALRGTDEGPRTTCMQVLVEVPDAPLDRIRTLLADQRPETRAAAAQVLVARGDAEAVPAMIEMLEDEAVREAVLDALAGMPDQALPALQQMLADGRVAEIAGEGIRRMGTAAVQPMLALLAEADEGRAARSVAILVGIGRPAVVPLVEVLNPFYGEPPRVRALAARVLGDIGQPRGVAALIALLEDPEIDVRVAAASALGAAKHPRAAPALQGLSRSRSPRLRAAVRQALTALAEAGVVEPSKTRMP